MKVKKIAITSLSAGTIGENFVKHEVAIGQKRLEDYGLEVVYSKNALKGIDYIKQHPESRAQDLIDCFMDDSIDMILCAIGGDDTYRLLPYLFSNDQLKNAIKNKIFLGFSDTTINHLMLHKLGFNTFYGQSFLADICELSTELLPYTKSYFEELLQTGKIVEVKPSPIWYESRSDFSESQIGKDLLSHDNIGFELLQGDPVFSGPILGGCIDTLYDIFDNSRYSDSVKICSEYNIFPSLSDWKNKILLLETSEEQPEPAMYRNMLLALKETGVFDVVNGVVCGKPMDEKYYAEYKQIICEVIDNSNLPIVFNLNIGHALPRCIIPFGVEAHVDVTNQVIIFDN